MNKWIKPSELPSRFHGHCWVVCKSWMAVAVREPYCAVVQNYYRGTAPDEWTDEGWNYLFDDNFRVMIVEKPFVSNNVFGEEE